MKTEFAPKVIRIKKKKNIDTTHKTNLYNNRFDKNTSENNALLQRCRNLFDNLSQTRSNRLRARKYYTGDQWHELVLRPDGKGYMREDAYIKSQGRIPFKQNMIYQLVTNIIGQYRSNPTKTMVIARDRGKQIVGEMLTNAIQSVGKINCIDELDAKNLLEFLLSGIAVSKSSYTYFPNYNKYDVFLKNVNLNTLFFNSNIDDPRTEIQINIIGEIIDTDIDSIIGAFAKNEQDEEEIRRIYSVPRERSAFEESSILGEGLFDNIDFYIPSDLSLCRYYEIWERKSDWRIMYHDYADGAYGFTDYNAKELASINTQRIEQAAMVGIPEEEVALIEYEKKYEQYWTVKYLSPWGHCLYERETPYQHEEHPYNIVMKSVDGIPISIVTMIIDQQRFINRLINLLDTQLGNSAKNMLFVPEDVISDGLDITDYANAWSSPNAVMKINLNNQNQYSKPFTVSSNSTDTGANALLSLQMQLINQIAGVNSAMQGHTASAGTPAALYAQEAQNSSINIKDALEIFNSLREKRDNKALKLIRQYYKDKRYVSTSGRQIVKDADVYDPNATYGVDTELVISQGMDTPAFRQLSDSVLMKLFEMQAIDVETYLENSSIPQADKILESVRNYKEKMQALQNQQMQQIEAQGQIAPIEA